MPFGQSFRAAADPMIEIVFLPAYLLDAHGCPLPPANHFRHARIPRELQEAMKMIWHQQEKFTPPSARSVILLRGMKQCRPDPIGHERGPLCGGHPDTDMK